MNKHERIHAPGKLFLAGEYAVTVPGQPALITVINRGITIDFTVSKSTAKGQITLSSSEYQSTFQTDWATVSNYNRQSLQTGSWTFIKAALAVFKQAHPSLDFGTLPNVELDISSTMKNSTGKLGLGSSAAVTVAIVKAMHTAFLTTVDPLAVFKEAAFAHYLVQGSGSLGDIAASAFAAPIYYQSPAWIALEKEWLLTDFTSLDWQHLKIEKINWASGWSFAIIASSEPASTRKALANHNDLKGLLEPSRKAVQSAFHSLLEQDYAAFRLALAQNQSALIQQLPEGYQTAKLAAFLHIIERLNIAGKISGAGFGDNGFVVGNDQHSLFPVRTAIRLAGLHLIESDN
ncbi:mevalonate kinase family protein [Fructobacillus fructosus]|uniref:phosphomevalonate kinase n=1 Tax=Fructobacillus fructosus TaxID=1631 RepID=A0ABM9MYE8_9LACO|nr:hypothetical protein [Fructobacillus fructosus]MBC9118401.1 hypothetical protein [Fructobacillus fructosus]MBD9364878.1 hypothetical protein [Leuconostoc mesenteroides]MCK8638749.1 hypothetical protein [Fructobacillus fructosus]CAK1249048.1 Mevalonate kinase (ERG12) [Fructobacillus fructosus]